jgi:hypothetical protein
MAWQDEDASSALPQESRLRQNGPGESLSGTVEGQGRHLLSATFFASARW